MSEIVYFLHPTKENGHKNGLLISCPANDQLVGCGAIYNSFIYFQRAFKMFTTNKVKYKNAAVNVHCVKKPLLFAP